MEPKFTYSSISVLILVNCLKIGVVFLKMLEPHKQSWKNYCGTSGWVRGGEGEDQFDFEMVGAGIFKSGKGKKNFQGEMVFGWVDMRGESF